MLPMCPYYYLYDLLDSKIASNFFKKEITAAKLSSIALLFIARVERGDLVKTAMLGVKLNRLSWDIISDFSFSFGFTAFPKEEKPDLNVRFATPGTGRMASLSCFQLSLNNRYEVGSKERKMPLT